MFTVSISCKIYLPIFHEALTHLLISAVGKKKTNFISQDGRLPLGTGLPDDIFWRLNVGLYWERKTNRLLEENQKVTKTRTGMLELSELLANHGKFPSVRE